MFDASVLCLAIAIFHESRGESTVAQFAVAETIHNRSKHPSFPSDYCSVIKQKSQFSFYKGSQTLKPPKYELQAWEKSVQVAQNFSKNKTNYTNGALYFNHKSLGIRYKITTRNGKPFRCGAHIFY